MSKTKKQNKKLTRSDWLELFSFGVRMLVLAVVITSTIPHLTDPFELGVVALLALIFLNTLQ